MTWRAVALADDVKDGQLHGLKVDGKLLLVGTTDGGQLFCVENVCPHEGYPLSQGYVQGTTLTCAWHNWKFDVRDGAGLLGGEGVRTFDVRVRGEHVEADLAEPPLEVALPKLQASVDASIERHDVGRGCRDAARMLTLGVDPRTLLAGLAAHDGRTAEYGTTHCLPVTADLIPLAAGRGVDATGILAVALDLAGRNCRRLRPRVRSVPLARGDEATFLRTIEDENVALAEAIVRGHVRAGMTLPELQQWLLAASAAHFTDFGHHLIYVSKLPALAPHLEREQLADVAGGLAVSLAFATREDTLPYMRAWFRRWEAEREAPWPEDAQPDLSPLTAAALDAAPKDALAALTAARDAGATAVAVAEALAVAAAHRLLRFDPAVAENPDVAEDWLWASHRLTFAVAVREAVATWGDRRRFDLLHQSLVFTRTGRGMDGPAPSVAPRAGDAIASIEAWDPEAAVAGAAAGYDRHALVELSWQDRFEDPIQVAHALKTTLAAIQLHDWTGDDTGVLAAVRMLATRRRERRPQAQARRAVRWVADGTRIKKLTQ